ncbi:MAG: orotidine-5'-phosphate decarboxylase [Bryobacteraceae bacterium]
MVALDFERLQPALQLAQRLAGLAGIFKIGKQLFTAEGPESVRQVAALGSGIFLDLKFHDIPNTVAGAIRSAVALPGLSLVNVHTLGGAEMMRAAAAAMPSGANRPKLLGVTILTSMDAKAMAQVGISGPPAARVIRLAKLAQKSGLNGVVASGHEVKAIRKACGKDFLIVTGGIRPLQVGVRKRDDQARVATPGATIQAGANYIVVGRPITAADDPVAAARAILDEIVETTARAKSAHA